ncbi:MAG: 50S ribosomal protein L1 [Erysipelotrichales bacterium]|nr:50S ribosomal protein L1 [Erysipelotrichales bacterium]MBQ1386700.1 50S ribosomal protein L1 [Erysipelotrichales bacterium]MBQ2310703.1 50S ribosomal protein L1 [Erysipelotrichales bacterium]MBQ2478684.1 50S ribosomal protein L1 [Erysipelotrichales bacterium]MBQ4374587.1 50S ribosomal protein L1 [Erysipelotrichales bacterium]
MKRGKKYVEAAKLVDRSMSYPIEEAVALVRKTNTVKFDASVEAAFRLNVDPRHADQQIRGAMVLPNGTGRTQKVLVIAEGPKAEEAKQAGADYVGAQDMLDEIAKGWLDFDVIIATPNMMGKLGRFGKLLGPKGLMPNPKTGTVTMDIAHAVNEVKKGKVTYRVDKQGNISCLIGKLSFTDAQLVENFKALYDQILRVRPAAVKGAYMKNVTVASTMGPGVRVAHD